MLSCKPIFLHLPMNFVLLCLLAEAKKLPHMRTNHFPLCPVCEGHCDGRESPMNSKSRVLHVLSAGLFVPLLSLMELKDWRFSSHRLAHRSTPCIGPKAAASTSPRHQQPCDCLKSLESSSRLLWSMLLLQVLVVLLK
jgi:hypothetical protein